LAHVGHVYVFLDEIWNDPSMKKTTLVFLAREVFVETADKKKVG
jgi:hypothetical protein